MARDAVVYRGASWHRGRATHRDGWIVLTDLEVYSPDFAQLAVVVNDFTGIRSPQHAVRFAERYGLLHHSGFGQEPYRERFSEWQLAIADLTRIVEMALAIRQLQAGVPEADELLRRLYLSAPLNDKFWFPFGQFGNVPLIDMAPIAVATLINRGKEGVAYEIGFYHDRDEAGELLPVRWTRHYAMPSLLALMYEYLGLHLSSARPELRYCDQCGRAFVVGDPRQLYCDQRCVARVRNQRKAARRRQQRESTTPIDEAVTDS